MATVQITTWDEFKTALTETITEATTYEIMNDIDVSGNILTEGIHYKIAYMKTFKSGIDENVNINGITTYSNINIFYTNDTADNSRYLRFEHINFTNFMLQEATLFAPRGSTGYSYHIYLSNCFINGLCRRLVTYYGSTETSWPQSVYFNQCSINVTFNPDTYQIFTWDVEFNNCYLIFNTTNSITSGYRLFGKTGRFTNCFIAGSLKCYASDTYLLNPNWYYSGTSRYSENNIINMTLENQRTSGTISAFSSSTGQAYKNLFNSDKITLAGTSTLATDGYYLTDAQMKSRTYIQENTNFPLYG